MWSSIEGMIVGGRYELRRHLATGGMAAVFAGWDHRMERPVAIKVLRQLDQADRAAVARFQREAHASALLDHPHVVRAYDFFEDDGCSYLVMELVDGVNLKQLLRRRGALPAEEALAIAEQVCAALHAAHALGFIHRDVKPQNILIDGAGRARVTDFGIVHVTCGAATTSAGFVLGTADYIAPEQARAEPLTPASDVYAMGVVLYEMLTGRLPFSGSTPLAIAMQHVQAPVPPPSLYDPGISPPVEAVVLRALQKDPSRRYQTAVAMRRALRAVRRALPSAPAAPAGADRGPSSAAAAEMEAERGWRELAAQLIGAPRHAHAPRGAPAASALALAGAPAPAGPAGDAAEGIAERLRRGQTGAAGAALGDARGRALVLALAALLLTAGTVALDAWLRAHGAAGLPR
jgi:serine/threonine-protein kinase